MIDIEKIEIDHIGSDYHAQQSIMKAIAEQLKRIADVRMKEIEMSQTENIQERPMMSIISDLIRAANELQEMATVVPKPGVVPRIDEPDWMAQAKDAKLDAEEEEE